MGLQMRFPDPKALEMNSAQFNYVVLGPVCDQMDIQEAMQLIFFKKIGEV